MRRLLRTIILLLVRLFGLSGANKAAQKARLPLPTAPRILLLRPDHLGDLVLTTPVFHALKTYAPDAHITMMVGPWSSEVVARHPDIDQLLTCPFPGFQRTAQKPLTPYILLFNVAKQLRRGNYDLAINLRPDFWWGAALFYLARIPRRVGYALTPAKTFLTHALPFQSPEHATVANLRLASAGLQALGYAPLEEPYVPARYPLQFRPNQEEQKWVSERLQQAGIAADVPLLVLHAGSGAAVKLWRTAAWAAIANALPDLLTWSAIPRIILTGSRSEQPMLEEIARGITAPPLLVTDATVGQLAALLGWVCLVVGIDSGPPHLAVAQGTPTVHIFGPADPRIFGPWGIPAKHVVVAATQRCPTCPAIPCGHLDIPNEEVVAHPCVRLIEEQAVLAAIKSVMEMQSTLPGTVKIDDTSKTTEQRR